MTTKPLSLRWRADSAACWLDPTLQSLDTTKVSVARPRIGMIGCGYWGPNLLRNLVQNKRLHVVTLAERSSDRRAFVAEKYPDIELVDGAAVLLKRDDLDAVVIATPADSHAELVNVAFDASKDVFVEKPLALSGAEAERLAGRADAEGRILMVGHTFLFNEAVREMKRRIDGGELGNLHYLYSQRLNLGIVRSDVNAAWNLAPHDISIACYLLQSDPVQVNATGIRALQPEAEHLEDVVFATVRFASGVVMHTHVSWLDPRKVRTMTVVGDRKMIVYDDVGPDKLFVYDKGITKGDVVAEEQASTFARHRMITRAGDLVIPNLRVPEPLAVEVEHFASCLIERTRPLSDGWSGVQVSKTLDAVNRSLAQGGSPIDLEIPKRS